MSGQTDQKAFLSSARIVHPFLSKPCNAELLKITLARTCALQDLLKAELLHALGTLALIVYLSLQYKEALILEKDRNIPIPETEQKILDGTHADVLANEMYPVETGAVMKMDFDYITET